MVEVTKLSIENSKLPICDSWNEALFSKLDSQGLGSISRISSVFQVSSGDVAHLCDYSFRTCHQDWIIVNYTSCTNCGQALDVTVDVTYT